MKVSYKWLKELVPLEWSPQELADRLTMAGLAVEQVYRLGKDMPGIVAGVITALNRHPDAENLLVARVQVQENRPALQVVTGARNIKVGDKVPLALPGARLPGGRTIGEAEFRGVVSQGMMCSAEELGLEPSPADEGGIMILPPDTRVGKEIHEVLGLDDYVLELDITPNRGDCLSMVGVAREVAALTGNKVQLPPVPAIPAPVTRVEGLVKVTVQDLDLCPRYSMRIITDTKIGPSPLWMQQRLRAAGMRPINNMVDVTNYVMLEFGQPLHAFDYDLIRGREVIVRRARSGEKIVTLDGQERVLTEETLVIADAEGPVGIAGVMGGANSEVTAGTRCVLLESACFNNISIRRTAKALGLRSEASNRFEKGVDPNGTLVAATRAAYLMEELGAGRVHPAVIDIYPEEIKPRRITVRPERISELLGVQLQAAEIKRIFTGLEFKVTGDGPFTVEVPTFRPDIELEYDLVEEVARIYGYDQIEGTMLQGVQTLGRLLPGQVVEDRVKNLLAGWGCTEIITYSFYSPRYFDYLRLPEDDPARACIELYNPLSEDQSVMRTTLLPSMIETMAANIKRKNTDLAFFELARTYWGESSLKELPREPRFLALGLAGRASVPHWNRPEERVDFFTLKGLVEALLTALGVEDFTFVTEGHPTFHPGRQATVYLGGEKLGVIGELHPDVAEAWDVRERLYVGELDFEVLAREVQGREVRFCPLPRYPAVVRDVALLVEEEVTAARIEEVIRAAGGELLVDVRLFDLYRGSQIPPGMKSLAYSLIYQAADRTLTDEEITALHQEILAALTRELGATLRE